MKLISTLMLFTCLLPSAFAQVFVTDRSLTELAFNGTFLGRGKSKTGIVTIRETPKTQEILIVLEVVDFKFDDSIQDDEFNDVFMETALYPQIRITGSLKEKIDLSKDGIYILELPTKTTIRRNSQESDFKIRLEITDTKMTFAFEKDLILTDYQVPYAGAGSEIGSNAKLKFLAHLMKRTAQ